MQNALIAQQRLIKNGAAIGADGDFGPKSWAALLAFVGQKKLGQMHIDLGAQAHLQFPEFEIDTTFRISHFLAQSCVETGGFTRLVENLNYSAERATVVWPKRFPTIASAQPFAHNPQSLANKVYGGRFGNANPGDGWKYRGRGMKQTTFFDNYLALQKATGLNVIDDPDQLADPAKGMRAGCVYWASKKCKALADADNILAITHAVNGGENGLADRKIALKRAKLILL
jgi:putative chitinase